MRVFRCDAAWSRRAMAACRRHFAGRNDATKTLRQAGVDARRRAFARIATLGRAGDLRRTVSLPSLRGARTTAGNIGGDVRSSEAVGALRADALERQGWIVSVSGAAVRSSRLPAHGVRACARVFMSRVRWMKSSIWRPWRRSYGGAWHIGFRSERRAMAARISFDVSSPAFFHHVQSLLGRPRVG